MTEKETIYAWHDTRKKERNNTQRRIEAIKNIVQIRLMLAEDPVINVHRSRELPDGTIEITTHDRVTTRVFSASKTHPPLPDGTTEQWTIFNIKPRMNNKIYGLRATQGRFYFRDGIEAATEHDENGEPKWTTDKKIVYECIRHFIYGPRQSETIAQKWTS